MCTLLEYGATEDAVIVSHWPRQQCDCYISQSKAQQHYMKHPWLSTMTQDDIRPDWAIH